MKRKTISGIKWVLMPLGLLFVSYLMVGVMKLVMTTSTVAAPSPVLFIVANFFYAASTIAFFLSLFGIPFGLYIIISEDPKTLDKKVFRGIWIVSLALVVTFVIFQEYRRYTLNNKTNEMAENEIAIGVNKKRHFWVNEAQVDFWMTETIEKFDPEWKDPTGWGINVRHEILMHPNEALKHAIVSFSPEGFLKPQGLLVIKGNGLVNNFYIPHWHSPAHVENIKWTTDTVVTYDFVSGNKTIKGFIDTEKDIMGLELVNDL